MGIRLVVIAWLVIALILRLPLLFDPLWYDEAFTLWLAQLDLPHLMAATAGDVHPPLWYLVEWQMARVSTSPFVLRLPALFLGVSALFLAKASLDASRLPQPVKGVALALMTISPFMAYYAAEARMYSLLLCLVLLAVWAALKRNWLAFGVAIAAGMLTHNLMVIYLPALVGIYIINTQMKCDPSVATDLIRAGAVTVVVYLPWLPFALAQLRAVTEAFWVLPLTPGRMVYLVYQVIAGGAQEQTVLHLVFLVLLLLIVGTIAAWRARSWPVLLMAISPTVTGLALSVLVKPVLISRVLIGSAPFLLVLVAWGGCYLYGRLGRWILLAGVPATVLMVVGMYANPVRPDYSDRYGRLPVQAGDICYHLTPASIILSMPYLPQCRHYLWPAANNLEQSLTTDTKTAMGMDQRFIEAVPPGSVTWLFHDDSPYSTPGEFAELNRILSKYPAASKIELSDNKIIGVNAWRLLNEVAE